MELDLGYDDENYNIKQCNLQQFHDFLAPVRA